MIPIIIGLSCLIFTIMYFVPGDPAQIILGAAAPEAELAAKREQLGLNNPYYVRLGDFLADFFFHGSLGESYITNGDVISEIFSRIPRTVMLGILSMIIAFISGILLGIVAAVHQNRWQDYTCMIAALLGISMPSFWLALLLVLLFSVKLGLLPSSGIGGIEYYILPAIANSFGGMAGIARQTRSSMLEVIRTDYITTARSKGLSQNEIIYRHALPNALIPIITLVGSQFGALLGGSLVIETIFGIPGLGTYMINGINNRDYPAVQGSVIIIGIVFSLCMLLVDIAYAYVDPRIKAQYETKSRKRVKA